MTPLIFLICLWIYVWQMHVIKLKVVIEDMCMYCCFIGWESKCINSMYMATHLPSMTGQLSRLKNIKFRKIKQKEVKYTVWETTHTPTGWYNILAWEESRSLGLSQRPTNISGEKTFPQKKYWHRRMLPQSYKVALLNWRHLEYTSFIGSYKRGRSKWRQDNPTVHFLQ